MIGKIVKVIVDRSLGSYHPTHKNIYYSVNYGYISEIMAGDGEEQDAYILAVDVPLTEFTGKVIAIIHRKNDNENKWIVVPENLMLSKEEILKAVDFQEKHFDIEIEI
jgi:inorganic pyrophosphatase